MSKRQNKPRREVQNPAPSECQAVIRILGAEPGVAEVMQVAEHAIATGEEEARRAKAYAELAGKRISLACRKGCSFCCSLRVAATAPEVLRIAEYVRSVFTPEEAQALAERLRALDSITRGMDTGGRASSGLPCALLEGGCCTVYPVRPLRCRGLVSFDAEACRRSFEESRGAEGVPVFMPQAEAMENVQTGVMLGLAISGVDSHPLELTAALRIALENPDAARRWLAGEPVFAPARIRLTRRG